MKKKIVHDHTKTLTILVPSSLSELKQAHDLCERYQNETATEFNMKISFNICKDPEEELKTNTHINTGTIITVDSKSQILDIERDIKQFIVGALMTAINKYERK